MIRERAINHMAAIMGTLRRRFLVAGERQPLTRNRPPRPGTSRCNNTCSRDDRI